MKTRTYILFTLVGFFLVWLLLTLPKNMQIFTFKWHENYPKNDKNSLKNDTKFSTDTTFENETLEQKTIIWEDFMQSKTLKLNKNQYVNFKLNNAFDKLNIRPYMESFDEKIDNNEYYIIMQPKDDWNEMYSFYDQNFKSDVIGFKNWLINDCTYINDDNNSDKVQRILNEKRGNCNAYTNIVVGYLKYLVQEYNIRVTAEYKFVKIDNPYALYHVYPMITINKETYNLDFTDSYYKDDIEEGFNKLKELLNDE